MHTVSLNPSDAVERLWGNKQYFEVSVVSLSNTTHYCNIFIISYCNETWQISVGHFLLIYQPPLLVNVFHLFSPSWQISVLGHFLLIYQPPLFVNVFHLFGPSWQISVGHFLLIHQHPLLVNVFHLFSPLSICNCLILFLFTSSLFL